MKSRDEDVDEEEAYVAFGMVVRLKRFCRSADRIVTIDGQHRRQATADLLSAFQNRNETK